MDFLYFADDLQRMVQDNPMCAVNKAGFTRDFVFAEICVYVLSDKEVNHLTIEEAAMTNEHRMLEEC